MNRALVPPKYNLLRLLHPGFADLRGLRGSSAVAWRRRRLLGTAAAREVPAADGNANRKRVSKAERKSMVEDYVSKYRMMNDGKFPKASDTQKQVGGSYYFVRGIVQKLEYDSKFPTVATTDENLISAGRTGKVNEISPLSIKEVEVSEVGEVLSSEVLVGTTFVSDKYGSSADIGSISQGEASSNSGQRIVDMSIGSKKNEIPAEEDSFELNGASEIVTKVQISTTVSTSYRISADMPLVSHYNEMSTGNENPWQTAKVAGISVAKEVVDVSADGALRRQGEVSNNSGHVMPILNNYSEVSAKHESSTVGQTTKTNENSEVREVLDSEVPTIVSRDNGIPGTDGSNSEGEASNNSYQTTDDTSNMTNYNEVSARDETKVVGQTVEVDEISEEVSVFPSKPGYPFEVPGACQNTEPGKIHETSSKASESDQLSREKNQNEAQNTSLWGNLKSLASSIISIWRR